ncbi:DUF1385 domain-containing protein [Mangrovibacillus cuniculi]|uniref:DUF1385 domain-containing protein n=1 Tax=Mangrovibacillus cuniculi TaxID=2593652 RepID=A0A7S8HFH5_9BACI|nr:DUF1385 domain-containing protein [Mangrovibacillus cuniculi]QPC46838.1 DUF1385 domain-containing protein [Mangrovibacillus cuniculi]
MSNEGKPVYGGQAVIEGVMFGGKDHTVTAVRRTDGSLDYFHLPREKKPLLQKLKRIPFVRGVVAIIEASATGTKHLNFSSERFEVPPGEEEVVEETNTSGSTAKMVLSVAAIGVLSFLFGKFLFTLIPAFAASLFLPVIPGVTGQVLLETVFKLVLLLAYIYVISLTPMIKRVFQYHGAEHKVINAYENNKQLTVENVQSQSRLHYRCGSSFILFTVLVGMCIYFFIPVDDHLIRFGSRILLIPVVLGISFEVLQFTNKLRDIPVLRYLGYPGLWLQLLTTKEPDNEQVEVAIASFEELLRTEKAGKPTEEKLV